MSHVLMSTHIQHIFFFGKIYTEIWKKLRDADLFRAETKKSSLKSHLTRFHTASTATLQYCQHDKLGTPFHQTSNSW